MGVALRGPNRHAGALRNLFKGQTERILEDDDARMVGSDLAETPVQLAAQLRAVCFLRRIEVGRGAPILEQRLARTGALAVRNVAARIDGEPVQPGRELRLAAKLPDPCAQLRERILRRVARVLGIAQQMRCQLLDPRGVALAQHREGLCIAVLCSCHQNRIAQPLVDEWPFRTEGLPDLTAATSGQLHVGSSVGVVADSLAPDAVEPLLRGRFGRVYRYSERSPSTQRLLEEGDDEGTVAVAEEQTEGRGRLGRSWHAPPRTSVLVSILLRPRIESARLPELSLIAGGAVAEAIAAVTGLQPTIKFPNDVLIGGRKVAGILAEASEGRVILGVGVNANQVEDELPGETQHPPTSLQIELGRPIDRAGLLAEMLLQLERAYDSWNVTGTSAAG